MSFDVEHVVRRSLKTVGQLKFHLDHRAQAKRVLRSIENRHGRTDPAQLKLADTYARDVFGNAIYAPWLRVYTAFSRSFKEGWIPDNYYGSVVVPNMKGSYGKLSDLKPLSRLIFDGEAFPDVAYFANGLFFTDGSVVIPAQELKSVVFRRSERVVFKLDSSSQGKGVYLFDKDTFDRDAIKALGNGVIQKFVVQHRTLSAFAAASVATLRLTTVVDDTGAVSLRACYCRFGREHDTHVRADTEISVPVDLATGELGREGYTHDWGALEGHPDSGTRFSGVTMPSFARCVALVVELHRKIPFVRCIGWDLTVDADNNVQVLEWNGEHNDVKFSEATQGPCFSDLKWEQLGNRQGDRT